MRHLRRCTTLVAWANAWLTGHVGLDEAVDVVEGVAGPSVVARLNGEDGRELSLRRGLGELRVAGLTRLCLALPVAGDPLGLCGPVELNMAAVDAGEAAVSNIDERPVGLVPEPDRRGSSYVGTRWTYHESSGAGGRAPDTPTLAEADRQLTTAIHDAIAALSGLGEIAGGQPEIAEALTVLRESHRHDLGGLAPGYPARAHRLAALAGRLSVAINVAMSAGGDSGDGEQRRAALRELDRAVRRGLVAACNSVAQ